MALFRGLRYDRLDKGVNYGHETAAIFYFGNVGADQRIGANGLRAKHATWRGHTATRYLHVAG